jgi:Ribosomal protein S24e
MYKANKEQVNVFGLRTKFGGGKTTGFALIYDSPEALKKFEPHYRLVRVGFATKIEKPSRQQRTLFRASRANTSDMKEPIANSLSEQQASNARTARRRSEVRPRSRVQRRRRRNRRLAHFHLYEGGWVCVSSCWFWEMHCKVFTLYWREAGDDVGNHE